MLSDLYTDHIFDGAKRADLRITAIPATIRRWQLITSIKPLKPMPSNALLAALRVQPTTVTDIECAAGIRAVRALHAIGVTCHLANIRLQGLPTEL